jgi:TPP-dependent pyruvate/acetoin dehydrogenase alpha subunit
VRYNGKVMENNYILYKTMLLIRRFEERLISEFSAGKLVGTTHTYNGQEADAAGIFSVTDPDDVVFSNHRCHGHFLAYGGDPYRLAAELMGSIFTGEISIRMVSRVELSPLPPGWRWPKRSRRQGRSLWFL